MEGNLLPDGDLQIPTTQDLQCIPNVVDECTTSEVQAGDTMVPNQTKRKNAQPVESSKRKRCLKTGTAHQFSFAGDERKEQEGQIGFSLNSENYNCPDIETQNQEGDYAAVEDKNDSNNLIIRNDEDKEMTIHTKKENVEVLHNLEDEVNNSKGTFTSIELQFSVPLDLLSANDSSNDDNKKIKNNEEVGECSTNAGEHSVNLDSEYIKSFLPPSIRFKNSESYPYVSLTDFNKMMKEKLETFKDHLVPETKLPIETEKPSTSDNNDLEEREIDYTQSIFYCNDAFEDSPVVTEDEDDTEFRAVKHPIDLPNLKQLITNKRNKLNENQNNYHDSQNLFDPGSSMQKNFQEVNNDKDSSQKCNEISKYLINNSTSQSEKTDTKQDIIIISDDSKSDDSKSDDKSDREDGNKPKCTSYSSDHKSLNSTVSRSTERTNDEESSESFYESEDSGESLTLRVSSSESSCAAAEVDIYDQETIVFGDDKIATTSTDVKSQNFSGDKNACGNNQEKRYFQTINDHINKSLNALPCNSVAVDDNRKEDFSQNKTDKSEPLNDEADANDDNILNFSGEQDVQAINVFHQIDNDELSNSSQKSFTQGNAQVVISKHDNEVASTNSNNESHQISHDKIIHDNILESSISRNCQIIKDNETASVSVEKGSPKGNILPQKEKKYDGEISAENVDDGNTEKAGNKDEEEIF